MSPLRIPPFPGAKVTAFTPAADARRPAPGLQREAAELARSLRVEGEYWNDLPSGAEVRADEFCHDAYQDPFDPPNVISLLDAIKLCGFWRQLIDSNRPIVGALGFGRWKQPTVAPLLWNGRPVPFLSAPPEKTGGVLAVWQTRTPPAVLRRVVEQGWTLLEVEDGFLRSHGLGADCVPPLSITVDAKGAYFDPSRPSELEDLLATADFDDDLLARSQRLTQLLRERGVGKYQSGTDVYAREGGDRRHILVPGQVEDDRSVQSGGFGMSNLALLRAVREARPEAFIIYKPHPDVEAGHRSGAIAPDLALSLADKVEAKASIASLLSACDQVHTITSQAGLEALIHGKPVWTYGVPFYAGWGLTHDLGSVPDRRQRKLTLEQLVAATLILYPRYLDPVSGLPCPAEVVVDRLSAPHPTQGFLVRARRLQGRMRRQWKELVG